MISAGKVELEQMLRDGKARPTVVKEMAALIIQLQGSGEFIMPKTKQGMVEFFEYMVANWPNTLESILLRAKENTQFEGSPTVWWRRFRNNLPAAAREII